MRPGGYVHTYRQDEQIGDPVQAAGDLVCIQRRARRQVPAGGERWLHEIKIPFVTSTMNIPFVNYFEGDYAFRYEEFTDHDLTNPNLPDNKVRKPRPHDLSHLR